MKKIWFKRKRFGWGWTPVSWQGWVIVLVYVFAMVTSAINANMSAHSGSDVLVAFALPFIVYTSILIFICYAKGEKPKWQWGKDR